MKDWLLIAGVAIVASVVWGTIPMLLLYWRRQRHQERETIAALQARLEQLEATVEHRDHVT